MKRHYHCQEVVQYAVLFFFFQAEDGIRDLTVTGVQTCALPIYPVASTDIRRRFLVQCPRAPFRPGSCLHGSFPRAEAWRNFFSENTESFSLRDTDRPAHAHFVS